MDDSTTKDDQLCGKTQNALECVEVLGRLSALFDERRRQLAENADLTVQQWQVLEEVQQAHFMPSMFAQQRSSSAAAVSKILRQLTNKNIITSHVSAKDARQRDYVVTSHGQEILDRVRAERKQAIDDVWLKLDQEQLCNFQSVGNQLADLLENYAAKSRQK